ncbi:MAG: hypothetical protein KDA53_16455 [Hyphomonas sp.]|nr:hypothetical protein [Hyphomonas sp.]
MADGSPMRASPASAPQVLGLDEAIRVLEAGAGDDITVDLGDGRIARSEGARGNEGLLQRLRGHKMMLALASGAADLSRFSAASRSLVVAPAVQEILDAAGQRH